MKGITILFFSISAFGNYSVQEASSLVKELEEFRSEIQTSKKSSKKQKRVLTLADILNRNRPQEKPKEMAQKAEVMDLDSIFKDVKTDQKTPVNSKSLKRLR